jgi:hypothetical protein
VIRRPRPLRTRHAHWHVLRQRQLQRVDDLDALGARGKDVVQRAAERARDGGARQLLTADLLVPAVRRASTAPPRATPSAARPNGGWRLREASLRAWRWVGPPHAHALTRRKPADVRVGVCGESGGLPSLAHRMGGLGVAGWSGWSGGTWPVVSRTYAPSGPPCTAEPRGWELKSPQRTSGASGPVGSPHLASTVLVARQRSAACTSLSSGVVGSHQRCVVATTSCWPVWPAASRHANARR